MTCASGFTWVAREPQLMDGAMGRASAQRFIEYHVLATDYKEKNGGNVEEPFWSSWQPE